MRIVFLVEEFYPYNSGVPVVARYLAEGLKEQYNHEVFAITKRNCQNPTDEYKGITIYRFDVSYSRGYTIAGDVDGLYKKIIELNPDVLIVECAQCVTTDIMLPHLHELNCKKILHSHDFSGLWIPIFKIYPSLKNTITCPKNHIIWKRYYNTFFRRYINDFDLLLYLTELGKDKAFFDKHASIRYEMLPNAADDIFFMEDVAKSETGLDLSNNTRVISKYCDCQSEKYLICLSNYGKIKNQKTVLREFYKSDCTDISMVFVGSEKNFYYRSMLKMKEVLDKKHGKRDVHFLTRVDRKDIPGLLSQAQLSLSASTWEAYSIALIEAMAVGTPFVSTDVGNARLLPGGITIKKASDMHMVISELLNDANQIKSLSDMGKQYSGDNCRKEKAVEKLNKLICEL